MFFKLRIVYYWLKIYLAYPLRSRQAIERMQARRLAVFAQKVLSKSKFYAPYWVGKTFDWEAVPQISKSEFMANFDAINTQKITHAEALEVALEAENSRDFKSEIRGITVGLSTGTSGKRGIFLVDGDERALWVALVMHRVIKPRWFKKQKVAFFLRANSNLYASVSSALFDFRYFDIFKPLPTLLQELQAYQPDIVASQPSVCVDIADAQKKQHIHITPKQIISFAEVLHEADKQFIENVFQLKMTEVYQCTEGFLGVTCRQGTMHLNEDFVKIEKEWLDEERFYPIITDFSRHSQPVVKYKLTDILQIKKTPCACGSSLLALEKIIGRDDDVLIFNQIKIYPDLISRRIAQKTDAFSKYTITQVATNHLEIGIESPAEVFAELKHIVQEVLDKLLEEFGIQGIVYTFSNKIDYIAGNKTRKIKRQLYEP